MRDLEHWKAYYTDLNKHCSVYDDYQHILDIIARVEELGAKVDRLELEAKALNNYIDYILQN